MSAYLRIEGVSKFFGTFQALCDITLDVHEGELVCFLGPSGCGKTTLLRAIAGLEPQSSGRIFQNGVDVSPLEPSQRDFGIVFQSYALFPNLTVAHNVGFGLRSIGRRAGDIAERVAYLLQLVGLADQTDKYPAQLSGGQQQRVALARALAIEPGLLLLDEPLSALDAQVRVRLRNELRDLQRKVGVTTIMVTHDQEEALAIADRIVVMNHGRVEQYGTPREIYGEPATRFVAGFVGEMNFLEAVVTGDGAVNACGHRLRCANSADTYPPGTEVTVCIRPEDIRVGEIGAVGENAAVGVLEEPVFLGSYLRLPMTLDGPDPARLVATLPTSAIMGAELTAGKRVGLEFDPRRLRLYGPAGTAIAERVTR